jgi:DNA-binding NtrC family response regulator
MVKILIVDDETAARAGMRKVLARAGFEVSEAADGQGALDAVRTGAPDVVLLDISIPHPDGLEVLRRLKEMPDAPLVIIITAYGSERLAAEVLRQGAYDYVPKPYEADELRAAARRAAETVELRRETNRLKAELERLGSYGELVGRSDSMRRVFELIEKVSPTSATVLVRGQSGTGKEMVAREIHRRGPRASRPFVVMNCAAMPETLVESELFGHERGAFTGAESRRVGKCEAADGGTLFLDEVGDMSPGTQAKVLRFLQESTFEPLGSTRTQRVDVRLISATNRDLEKDIEREAFRRDLYHRIKVVQIDLPPLAEHPEDIPLLAEHFLDLYRAQYPGGPQRFSPEALHALQQHGWPGNVRELKHTIESALVTASGPQIVPEHLGLGPTGSAAAGELSVNLDLPYAQARAQALDEFERRYLGARLEEHEGNISATARALGLYRQTLQNKLKKLGLR